MGATRMNEILNVFKNFPDDATYGDKREEAGLGSRRTADSNSIEKIVDDEVVLLEEIHDEECLGEDELEWV